MTDSKPGHYWAHGKKGARKAAEFAWAIQQLQRAHNVGKDHTEN